MSDKAHFALTEWKPVNDRMAYARFKGKFCNISVISVYAPTLSADDRDKDKFYAELQLLTKSLPKDDIIIIGGDWNARVGHNAAAMTSTIGKYGIGDRCANGERLRYAEEHELFVTNICFRHHKKHLVTWNSPDNQHFNQIDYILVNRRWKSSVLDSRSYRGTGNLHGSDHVMVRAKIRIKLTIRRKQHPPSSFNYLKLKNSGTVSAFQSELLKHLNDTNINDFSGTANEYWCKLKECLRKSATSRLGHTITFTYRFFSGSTEVSPIAFPKYWSNYKDAYNFH
ncbi:unnamed protein product [Dracunculus medinensis]|uniref:Endo/exonuclease/phosphatase domain-containing protein n=1 Tax=Dracunculus medinensis TaxID=318479 RepID=A0A0N4UNY0_DRAME|nr:unnamed protein product [Dracunculus medinensis]